MTRYLLTNKPANSVLETWTHAGLSLPIWSADETDYFITSGWPTTQELNEDLYLRRSYLTLFLNGTGYQESKLES